MKLRKTLEKGKVNPGIRYAFSLLYFHDDNPAFNLDSAYQYAVTALDDYAAMPAKERDRLRRLSVDSVGLITLRARIDSTAFAIARTANTEAAYLEFLSHFPSSVQRGLAEKLRDEVAFQNALRENTHQAFHSFLQRYPDAGRAAEARAIYDRLLYLSETKDKRLSSYEKFLTAHPESRYRDEVYRHIFEISTADGSVESFTAFAARHPASYLVRKARQMIFHLLLEDEGQWPEGILNDSLQRLLDVRGTYLVPVLKGGHYGFMDETGKEILAPAFQSIDPGYLCGLIDDEFLRVDNRLINRSGTTVYSGELEDFVDLGRGFLKIRARGIAKVIHKAGFHVHDSVEDAKILIDRYMAVKKNNSWRLYTLTGRLLDSSQWEALSSMHDVVVFTKDEKIFIAPISQLVRCADGLPLKLSGPFDEVKAWPHGLLWGRSGDFQGVLDQSLEGVIGFDKHILTRNFFGATAALPNGFSLYNWKGKRSSTFQQVEILVDQVAVKTHGSWFFYDPSVHEFQSQAYDSIRAEGPFLLGLRGDSTVVHFDNGEVAAFFQPLAISFVPGMDSTSFLVVHQDGLEKRVFDHRGKQLFSAAFEALEHAGQGVFVVTRNGKKGLLGMKGEKLLPPDFDAIGSAKAGFLSILKNKKFGAYSIEHKKKIKPQYDRNVFPYNENLVIVFKDRYCGLQSWDNRSLTAFEFDEIVYWDDSLALVRKGSHWNFYDIALQRLAAANLRKIIMIKNSKDEKIAIVQKGDNYGVINNRGKVVIPLAYSIVMNLGSADQPLYFTEKHIEEASLFIVIYYDGDGVMLRKEVYDNATDYDKIYCPGH